ncbi:MAG: hypothetical protein OEY07_15580, partial [Gammaproteobacteria bacterium]|nr:hypothetical protein [Gammaproteobacteria bacterium]
VMNGFYVIAGTMKYIKYILLFLLLSFPQEGFVSGLASTRTDHAYSRFYQLTMESGRFISIRHDRETRHQYSVINSEGIIKELEKYMSIIDEWVAAEQVHAKIQTVSFDKNNTFLNLYLYCNEDNTPHESVLRSSDPRFDGPFGRKFEHVLAEFSIRFPVDKEPGKKVREQLQASLCQWMKKHETAGEPIAITAYQHETIETQYGVYEKRARNIRSDLADSWKRESDNHYNEFKTAIENTITLMAEKYDVELIPHTPVNHSVKGTLVQVYAGNFSFAALIKEDEDEFAYLLLNAFHYHLDSFKGNLHLSSGTTLDLRYFLKQMKKEPYVSAKGRKQMRNEVAEVQRELSKRYGKYGVEIRFSDMYANGDGWDSTRRYHINLPLLRRLVTEADENGKIMQNNAVDWVHFRTDPWEDDKQKRRLSVNVHSKNMQENNSIVFDVHYAELDKKAKQFYEVFQCTTKDFDPGFSVKIK